MRYSAAEKLEIIRLVEQSDLSVCLTLEHLGIPDATLYQWYDRYQKHGFDGLQDKPSTPPRAWNRIPEQRRDQILDLALAEPDLSPREIANAFTDERRYYFVSIHGLSDPQGERSDHQPGVHSDEGRRSVPEPDDRTEPALADRLHLSQGHWLGLVLSVSAVLDDFSRHIVAWRLCTTA